MLLNSLSVVNPKRSNEDFRLQFGVILPWTAPQKPEFVPQFQQMLVKGYEWYSPLGSKEKQRIIGCIG
jgi:hypothetical protein